MTRSIRTRVLTRVIGSRWRTFCGYDQEAFIDAVVESLDDLEYDFTVSETEPTDTERTMFGADTTGYTITVEDEQAFEIGLIPARIDPIAGFMMRFVLPEQKRQESTEDLCVVTVSSICRGNREAIASLLADVIDRLERCPWDVSHHASFRLAVLLRVKVRVLWQYWCAVARSDSNSSTAATKSEE